MAPLAAPLLAAALALSAGATGTAAGTQSGAGTAAADTAAGAAPLAPAGVQAFYILFSTQVDSPDWPSKLCQNAGSGPKGSECVPPSKYKNGVFIASPQNMTKDHIAKVKQDVPGSKVVVRTSPSTQLSPTSCCPVRVLRRELTQPASPAGVLGLQRHAPPSAEPGRVPILQG